MRIEEELKSYLQVIWHYKFVILACTIVAGLTALAISLLLNPLYAATTTVRVASAPGGESDYIYVSSFTRLSNTYVEIATSDITLDNIMNRLGLPKQPEVEVEVVPETELITITATDPDPVHARDIANTLAALLIEQSMELYAGDSPTAREVLEGQLKQAKMDLDSAVAEYDKALRAASIVSTPSVSATQISIPDINNLERLVTYRQQTYSYLLQEYQNTKDIERKEALDEQIKQAKIDLDGAISEYNAAIHTYQEYEALQPAITQPPDPQLEVLANLIKVRQQIYADMLKKYEDTSTSEQLRTNAITIVEPASLPIKPSSPKVPINVGLGVIGGFAVGIILAFLFEGMDDTLRDIDDVQAITSLPILCRVPDLKRSIGKNSHRKGLSEGILSMTRCFDQLRNHLILFDADCNYTSFLVTGAEPGSGKSSIAANLAISLSRISRRVVLVDMDFYRPRQHKIFNLQNECGLSDYIRGGIQIENALQKTKYPNLAVITAGKDSESCAEWITMGEVGYLLETLDQLYDFVLIDSPALLSTSEPIVLASKVDAVIVVAARRQTERKDFRYALGQLNDFNAKVIGVVLNRVPNSQLYSYYAHPKS